VERKNKLDEIAGTFMPFMAVLLAISALILLQPDFGTLTIVLIPAIVIYFVAGLTWKQILIGLAIAAVGVSLVLSTEYRRERVLTFLNPEQDTSGSAYHIKNISIAIGSGGLTGLGFGDSKQKRLFLPEPHTDSIFAVISEELGSLRSVFIILIFTLLIQRGFSIAIRAPDMFGQLLAVGITTWFGFQAFINLGSMLHLVPLVGVPLPFISYGGTNLVISLIAAGVLLNISRFAKPASKKVKK
jgi:cell division protein FtsW